MVLMVAFSRNYLGVHTPQDVLVALTLSICCLYFMRKLFLRLEEHPEEEDKWLLIFFLVSAAALVYVTVKPYPMDYVDGKLLVDPKDMMRDGYKDFGQMCALCLGRCALVLVIIFVWPVVIRMICGQEECRTQKDRLHNGDNTK